PRTERVSTTRDGSQADGPSRNAALSADGRYAGFTSTAATFGCAPFFDCLRVKDLTTGEVTEVGTGDGATYDAPLLSADGGRIAYTATKRFAAPYLYDRATGTSQRLWPENPPGSNELGAVASISPDGTHVAYTLGNRHGDQNSRLLYVRSTATGTDELISPPEEGRKDAASVSGDGGRVAYQIGAGDTSQILVKDRTTGTTTCVATGLGAAELVRITANGHRVLLNAQGGLYVHDLRTGTTERVADAPADSATDNGRYALIAEPKGPQILDLKTGERTEAGPADASAGRGTLARNGRTVAFTSEATDLVPGDTNGTADVFVRHRR
ncbi:TolB family protein, partial [Streptomyces anatolicus]|uniref:TolB family protein n=1 Tax=Streptomyces anatolicus TaxID=2675858 RepID=UPI00355714AA